MLSLEDEGSQARPKIDAEIVKAIAKDGAEVIALGCAGMAALARSLSMTYGVPVIDAVGCAVILAEGLARLGLATSKRGAYAAPWPKTYTGLRTGFAADRTRA